MAFVPLVSASLSLIGKSGARYELAFTKATAVGFCLFTQDGQSFWRTPEPVQPIDCYIGDAVNAADYLDFYINSIQKIQQRIFEDGVNNATTVPRMAPRSWIPAGAMVSLYHYSA